MEAREETSHPWSIKSWCREQLNIRYTGRNCLHATANTQVRNEFQHSPACFTIRKSYKSDKISIRNGNRRKSMKYLWGQTLILGLKIQVQSLLSPLVKPLLHISFQFSRGSAQLDKRIICLSHTCTHVYTLGPVVQSIMLA